MTVDTSYFATFSARQEVMRVAEESLRDMGIIVLRHPDWCDGRSCVCGLQRLRESEEERRKP